MMDTARLISFAAALDGTLNVAKVSDPATTDHSPLLADHLFFIGGWDEDVELGAVSAWLWV
jgi:hypothetical protein